MQHRGVQVGDVMSILGSVEAKLVGGTVDQAATRASAADHDAEAVRMVIAARSLDGAIATVLAPWRAAELAADNDQRLV